MKSMQKHLESALVWIISMLASVLKLSLVFSKAWNKEEDIFLGGSGGLFWLQNLYTINLLKWRKRAFDIMK